MDEQTVSDLRDICRLAATPKEELEQTIMYFARKLMLDDPQIFEAHRQMAKGLQADGLPCPFCDWLSTMPAQVAVTK